MPMRSEETDLRYHEIERILDKNFGLSALISKSYAGDILDVINVVLLQPQQI